MATLTNDALVPVFTTKVRRHARQLDLPDASVEIAFDEGMIEAGGRQEALSEIELELKSGNAGILFDLGTQLLDAAPLKVGTRSKAERGYALAFDVVQPAAKAEPFSITAEHVVDDVIALLVGACWHHLLKNQAVAEEGSDPEGVHQMRVALRRLRTICALFRRDIPSPAFQTVNSEARWLMQQLGPARDWDVFAETTVTRLVAAAPDVDFGGLREAVERQRKSSYAALQTVLADPRCSRFLLSLGHLVERRGWRNEIDSEALAALSLPMPTLANKILARLHRKALRRGAHFRQLNVDAQHDLRIDLKKLRYAAEFFLPLYRHACARQALREAARQAPDQSRTRARHRKHPHSARCHQAGRPACASSRHRRGGRLASPRSDCGGENAAQEMAAVQSDASILGPVSPSFAPCKLRCPKRVIRVTLTVGQPLPVRPDQRTFSAPVGMSQRCHKQKSQCGTIRLKELQVTLERGQSRSGSFILEIPPCEDRQRTVHCRLANPDCLPTPVAGSGTGRSFCSWPGRRRDMP